MAYSLRQTRSRLLRSPIVAALFFLVFIITLASMPPVTADEEKPPLPTDEDVRTAYGVLMEWGTAYQKGDYLQQWRLTDFRIRHWHDRKRFKKWMRRARKRDGKLLSFKVEKALPLYATQLPCTEMGHCYRKDVDVILFLIASQYEKASPPQPEYIVMARSKEGWRFGGGTFPNRPMGETSLILDRKDERRYEPSLEVMK